MLVRVILESTRDSRVGKGRRMKCFIWGLEILFSV